MPAEFGWIVFESSNMMFLIKSISVTYQTLIIMEDISESYFGSFQQVLKVRQILLRKLSPLSDVAVPLQKFGIQTRIFAPDDGWVYFHLS